ncbi:hypothetical protein BJX62DRAFT_190926 [Aspergillus germanicus]
MSELRQRRKLNCRLGFHQDITVILFVFQITCSARPWWSLPSACSQHTAGWSCFDSRSSQSSAFPPARHHALRTTDYLCSFLAMLLVTLTPRLRRLCKTCNPHIAHRGGLSLAGSEKF